MTNEAVVIREYEEILKGDRNFDEASDNWTILKAYEANKAAGNARLDFNDVIWDEDIKAIADTMRKAGIREFTISVHQGNLIDVLTAFQELGVFIRGMVQVRTRYQSLGVVSAVLMQVA